MKMESHTILSVALITLMACSVPVVAEAAGDVQVETLQIDPSFPRLSLASADLVDNQIEDFAVIGKRIYFPHRPDFGERRIGFVDIPENDASSETRKGVLTGWQPGAYSFHAQGSFLRFYDRDKKSLVTVDPLSGGIVNKVRTGYSAVASLRLLKNGMYVAVSGNMLERPVGDFRSLEGRLSDEEIIRITTSRKGGRVFILGPNFSVQRTIKRSRLANKGINARDRFLERYQVRVDETGSRFVVFGKHQPGIDIFSMSGELLTTLVHPGEGRQVQTGHPLQGLLGMGTRFLYQTDVLLHENALLISDPASGLLWRFDLSSRLHRAFRLPFDVISMQKSEGYLYFLGLGGRIERFRYPE